MIFVSYLRAKLLLYFTLRRPERFPPATSGERRCRPTNTAAKPMTDWSKSATRWPKGSRHGVSFASEPGSHRVGRLPRRRSRSSSRRDSSTRVRARASPRARPPAAALASVAPAHAAWVTDGSGRRGPFNEGICAVDAARTQPCGTASARQLLVSARAARDPRRGDGAAAVTRRRCTASILRGRAPFSRSAKTTPTTPSSS